MNVDYIDTDKLREIGNNILSETNIFKSNIDFLYDRINNINSKTFEWVGNGANNFSSELYSKLSDNKNWYLPLQ